MVKVVIVRFAFPRPLAGSSLCRCLLRPTEESLAESVWGWGCHRGAARACGSFVWKQGLAAGVLYAWRTASHSVKTLSMGFGRNGDRWEDAKSLARRRGAFVCRIGRRAKNTAVDRSYIWSLTAWGNSSLRCRNVGTLASRYESSKVVGWGAW